MTSPARIAALFALAGCSAASSVPPPPDSSPDSSGSFDVEAFCSDTPTGPDDPEAA